VIALRVGDVLQRLRAVDLLAVRRVLFVAFVIGLGLSITLSEAAMYALGVLWLWRLRDPAVRRAQDWPLWQPMLFFIGATLLAGALSNDPWDSLSYAPEKLTLPLALYVTADALDGVEDAAWFISWLTAVTTIAAAIGLLQVSVCPSSEVDTGTPRWLYHRCWRARGPFSIYMTLAGVLSLVLLAGLPRLLPGAGGVSGSSRAGSSCWAGSSRRIRAAPGSDSPLGSPRCSRRAAAGASCWWGRWSCSRSRWSRAASECGSERSAWAIPRTPR